MALLKSRDLECPNGHQRSDLVADDEVIHCTEIVDDKECGLVMKRIMGAPQTFKKIVPTYPGSQKHKAGYVHKHVNRPAEKTQVGFGGGVSTDHPTGSTKNK